MTSTQPWDTQTATREINAIAKCRHLNITYKLHAKERLSERSLVISDVLYALKNGFVYIDPIAATRPGHFRYRVECKTPNSGSRAIGVVIIPSKSGCLIKVVSVMWIDEYETITGSIIGVEEDE